MLTRRHFKRDKIDAAEPVNESVGRWALERTMVGGGGGGSGGGFGLDRGARGVPHHENTHREVLVIRG